MDDLETQVNNRLKPENRNWKLIKPGKMNYIADNISHGLSKKFVPGSPEEKTALLTQEEQTLFVVIPNDNDEDWFAKKFFKSELRINVNYNEFKNKFEKNKNETLTNLLKTKNSWLTKLEKNNRNLLIEIVSNANNWYQTVEKLKELEKLKEPNQPTQTQSAGKKRKPRTKKSRKSKRHTLKK